MMPAAILQPDVPQRLTDDTGLIVQMRSFPCPIDLIAEAGWRDLERRSIHSNPFLSSSFVLAQREWEEACDYRLVTIVDGGGRWLAAGLFRPVSASRQMPLPFLEAALSQHSYVSGMLMDRERGSDAADALWDFARRQGFHGISFPLLPTASEFARTLAASCSRRRLTMHVDNPQQRAMTSIADASRGEAISEKRARSLKKGRKALEKQGAVSLRFSGCHRHDMSAVARFLHLESLGWKGEQGSALASRRSDAEGFWLAALGLGEQDRVQFAELLVGEQTIASLCLLRSQETYFAFKIGWDPQFERGCPGFLLAARVRERIHELPGCERIDSCARPGSFLEHVWGERIDIASVLFPTTQLGSAAASGANWARGVLRKLRGNQKSTRSGRVADLPIGDVP
jgi:CelD/BcsL family acetyltransferase involved in cellulose biosynthesis